MSIHSVSPFASKAAAVLVLIGANVILGAATAESGTQSSPRTLVATYVGESHGGGSHTQRAARSCRVIERPKHSIIRCDCSGDPLAGVASVDVAAILRLFVGNPTCRAPTAARR